MGDGRMMPSLECIAEIGADIHTCRYVHTYSSTLRARSRVLE